MVMSTKIIDKYAKQLADLREKKIQKIKDVENAEAEMRCIEDVRENRKGHKDRATFDTSATIQLQAQRLDSLKDELREIERDIRDFEDLVSGA
ncbi:uncharacterized protein BP5553_10146 [Venustampulla echinocandica]|uniref:Uncharacterized protein n=1 Tax=Venustampulla echinocandica TaxID=2656787 RepID=A0A370TAJ7_9HELO|nr:uncharacterized protein BP5553_10146 [Venustampulla echinocandica]RDL30801.1 hypothetical protein BP5553_10146 [Venustampulla echinocandica]